MKTVSLKKLEVFHCNFLIILAAGFGKTRTFLKNA
jgi:hypothetical protein